MKTLLIRLLLTVGLCLGSAFAFAEETVKVRIETSMGDMVLELYPEKAPKTVANFLRYADEGFYDGTIFHRVIDGFMIQGGGFTPDMERKETHEPIPNEADNGLRNGAATIAMARTNDPHSATSQFFINLVDNSPLDHREKYSSASWGYCVFGKVIEGRPVVKTIGKVATGMKGMYRDVPVETVTIKSIKRIEESK